jgi:predicted ester cyclase
MSITAFPDLVVTVHDQIAEGDRVVTRWTAEGTHSGDFLGHAATGKRVEIKAIHIHQVVGGKMATLWEEIDERRLQAARDCAGLTGTGPR